MYCNSSSRRRVEVICLIGEMTSGHRGPKLNEQEVSSSEEAGRSQTLSSGEGHKEGSVFLLPRILGSHISPGRKQTTTTQWSILASPSIVKQYPPNCWWWCSAAGGPTLGDVVRHRSPYKSAGQKGSYYLSDGEGTLLSISYLHPTFFGRKERITNWSQNPCSLNLWYQLMLSQYWVMEFKLWKLFITSNSPWKYHAKALSNNYCQNLWWL